MMSLLLVPAVLVVAVVLSFAVLAAVRDYCGSRRFEVGSWEWFVFLLVASLWCLFVRVLVHAV